MKKHLKDLIGPLPAESDFRKRMRLHQAWWRAFVLAEEPGFHPVREKEMIGSVVTNGRETQKNFLSPTIAEVVAQTIEKRRTIDKGIIAEDRLYNNLLSSQPVSFNFFGSLKKDTCLALHLIRSFFPQVTQVVDVLFEFAPPENYTCDNSAFDVAFEVLAGNQRGLIGFECKYTDKFSHREYDRDAYRKIYLSSGSRAFLAPYDELKSSRFNQLFRNQLIAEALMQEQVFDFVVTGLFCHPQDQEAIQTGQEFQKMLKNGADQFRIITYRDFIEKMQLLDLSWEQRELSMLLWARYCGTQLSESTLVD